jgi:hypothetical protein
MPGRGRYTQRNPTPLKQDGNESVFLTTSVCELTQITTTADGSLAARVRWWDEGSTQRTTFAVRARFTKVQFVSFG